MNLAGMRMHAWPVGLVMLAVWWAEPRWSEKLSSFKARKSIEGEVLPAWARQARGVFGTLARQPGCAPQLQCTCLMPLGHLPARLARCSKHLLAWLPENAWPDGARLRDGASSLSPPPASEMERAAVEVP
jgi:hypothetical protein